MNEHLTHQELTDHLLGTRSATVEAHLASCSACSKELYQFRESLASFRGAVHGWSEAEHPARPKALSVPRSFDWLLVGAVAILLLTFAVISWRDRTDNKQVVTNQQQTTPTVIATNSAAQIQQDNELLANINQELSEELPAPMQPLQVESRQTTGNSTNQQ